MKSERRHELQQNELADWMAGTITKVKPYANAIMGVVLAVLIVVVAAVLWAQKIHADAARSWEDLHSAMSSVTADGNFTELENVIDQYPGTDAAYWAAVVAGDLHLARGCDELFSNKASANQELSKAVTRYEDVLESSNSSHLERATFGLARARESQGQLPKAEKHYQELLTRWPESPYAAMAQSRLDTLKQPAVKEFYDRFAKFEPKRSLSAEPGGRVPFDAASPPAPGEPLFPPLDPLKLQQQPPPKTTPEETKPGEAKPAEAKPAETKPAAAPPEAPNLDTTPPKDAVPKADAAPKDEKK